MIGTSAVDGIPGADELERIARALGATPPVTHAAAHVYPAAAPDFERRPFAQRTLHADDPLRLYVHIPFCSYKCSFCYYATRVGDDRDAQQRYVAALERELEVVPPGRSLVQLFMGGGTPTVLDPELLDRLLATIFAHVSRDAEEVHTVEASPESLSDAHIAALRRHGIRRISMGVQSLDDAVLDRIHRRHHREQVIDACDRAVAAGLILNVDLMYGLPGQSEASFDADLGAIADRGVHSLTLYDLRTTQGSAIGRALQEEERLELEQLLRWRRFVRDAAAARGFTQTRWHTFKRLDGIASDHQRAACNHEDGRGYQIGLGMSARSHVGYSVYRNHERMRTYVERVESGRSPVEYVFPLDEEGRRTQFLARTIGDGGLLDPVAYERIFGRPLSERYGPVLDRHRESGLIEERDGALHLTEPGRLLYDRVLLGYYPKRALDWLWSRA